MALRFIRSPSKSTARARSLNFDAFWRRSFSVSGSDASGHWSSRPLKNGAAQVKRMVLKLVVKPGEVQKGFVDGVDFHVWCEAAQVYFNPNTDVPVMRII